MGISHFSIILGLVANKTSMSLLTFKNNLLQKEQCIKQLKQYEGKGKDKGHPTTGPQRPRLGVNIYSSTLSLISVLDGVGRSTPRAPSLYAQQRAGIHCTGRLVEPQGQSGRVRKILPRPRFEPWTVHPIASRYTD